MIELKHDLILHAPQWYSFQRGDIHFRLDPARPHWAAADDRGAWILGRIDGRTTFGRIHDEYRTRFALPPAKAWLELHDFMREALGRELIGTEPFAREEYAGRDRYLKPEQLREFWVHLLQTCNLSCSHCLVSSGPKGEKGSDTAFYQDVLSQASALGAHRFYFTGGEPMIRPDFFELTRFVTEKLKGELIVLSNATLIRGAYLKELAGLNKEKVRFQVSLDGAAEDVNDAIRGKGCFRNTSRGIRELARLGFEVSLTAAVTKSNLKDLEELPELAKKLGVSSIHLMWLHKRGRAAEDNVFPSGLELIRLYRKVRDKAAAFGIRLDNEESFRQRLRGTRGVKNDLSNACWESLCLYHDGNVYPTAATAGHERLSLGSAKDSTLKSLWLDSPVARDWRSRTLASMSSAEDPFRFLTGGGDLEHAYFFSGGRTDPYHALYVEALKDSMESLAVRRVESFNRKSGYSAPVVWYAMGEEQLICAAPGKTKEWLSMESPVRTLHSNCVLAFDVDKPYRVLQKFYGDAAEKPQEDLCCPVKYDPADTAHIPKEVLDRFYGCGSPVGSAGLKPGETFADLGSGGGIDCFIAAKKVGATGKVIGVDMTDPMLKVANENRPKVAENLGYANVEFRKGVMEKVPIDDDVVDCLSSNCVLNLSPDKKKVFSEMWRILKDHGRICVADIVSDRPVPVGLQANERLWGECLTGALSEEEFLSELERAGFYGLRILKKTFWKSVEDYKFYSVTLTAHKFKKRAGCRFIGQQAIYLGPWKSVMDEEGHLFPRNESVEICTDTAAKLKNGVYAGRFRILEPKGSTASPLKAVGVALSTDADCDPQGGCC